MRKSFPPPKNEDEFEDFCLKLLRSHWECGSLQRLGSRGERQFGVDIIDLSGAETLRAAQCKCHGIGKTIPPQEIRDEVDKAKEFSPPIDKYAILTTAGATTLAQQAVIEINTSHREQGLFLVELVTWNQIEEILNDNPELAASLYPGISGIVSTLGVEQFRAIQGQLKEIHDDVRQTDHIEQDIEEAKRALDNKRFAEARILFERIRRNKWVRLSDRQKYRVLVNISSCLNVTGDVKGAGELLVQAVTFQQGDKTARAYEALGFEFQGKKEKAFDLAKALVSEHPDHEEGAAVLIRTCPSDQDVQVLLAGIDNNIKESVEVTEALAFRFLHAEQFSEAEENARKTVHSDEARAFAWLYLAQAVLSSIIRETPFPGACSPQKMGRLKEANSCFSKALKQFQELGFEEKAVSSLVGRAVSSVFLGDTVAAEADFKEAYSLNPNSPELLFRFGVFELNRQKFDAAISLLERAGVRSGQADIEYLLAGAFEGRNNPGDRSQAIERLRRVLTEHPNFAQRRACLWSLVRNYLNEGQFDSASNSLKEFGQQVDDDVLVRGLEIEIDIAAGRKEQAVRSARELANVIPSVDSLMTRRVLASTFGTVGMFKEALELWLEIIDPAEADPDFGKLMYCAHKLRDDASLLKLCEQRRLAGHYEFDVFNYEVDLLETYDPVKAVNVLKERLEKEPSDRFARLRLSIIGVNQGDESLVCDDPQLLPSPEELNPRQASAVLFVLRNRNKFKEAVNYAYEYLRLNFDSEVAHGIFISTLFVADQSKAASEWIDSAENRMAFLVIENGETVGKWYVVEENFEPKRELEEISPSSVLAKRLVGCKEGDQIVLAEADVQDRLGTVKEVLSKFVYRYRDSMHNFQIRFPGSSGFQMVKFPKSEKDGEEKTDFSDLYASLDRRYEVIKEAEQAYKEHPISLHMFTEWVGGNLFETVSHLAARESMSIRVCYGNRVERDNALRSIGISATVVLDLSAIATLANLDLLDALKSWPVRFGISPATLQELRNIVQMSGTLEPAGRLGKSESGYFFHEESKEQIDGRKDFYKSALIGVEALCDVLPCYQVASLEASRKEQLEKLVGLHGLESIILGSETGHLLWSDDQIVRLLGEHEFGTKGCWSQVVLAHGTSNGYLDSESFLSASVRMIAVGYSFTWMSAEMFVKAAVMSSWEADSVPFKQVIEYLSSENVEVESRIYYGALAIKLIYDSLVSEQKKQAIIIRLMDEMLNGVDGKEVVGAIVRVLPRVFGLDVINYQLARQILDAWMASKGLKS